MLTTHKISTEKDSMIFPYWKLSAEAIKAEVFPLKPVEKPAQHRL